MSEKRAPVQGFSAGIPWSMHLRAYDAYCKKWSPQPAMIDLEGRNCRGGFSVGELDELIPGWREELSELTTARSTISEQEKRIAELEAERDAALESETQATDCAKEAHAIVSRVWKALGISNYADAQGKAIDEIVANLLESHKRQLRERREEELREDERLGKMMARAEAAEQTLTSERQRREEAEAIARPLAQGWHSYGNTEDGKLELLRGTLGIWHFKEAAEHFRKYEPGK